MVEHGSSEGRRDPVQGRVPVGHDHVDPAVASVGGRLFVQRSPRDLDPAHAFEGAEDALQARDRGAAPALGQLFESREESVAAEDGLRRPLEGARPEAVGRVGMVVVRGVTGGGLRV